MPESQRIKNPRWDIHQREFYFYSSWYILEKKGWGVQNEPQAHFEHPFLPILLR
jgi:hypothetical protein